MIHTTPNSGKFRRLVRKLRPLVGNVPIALETIATGLLERLWHVAISDAIRGNVGKFDNEELAELIGWHGDANALIELLADERWLDRCEVHRLLIHDWADHAPRHVKANAARQGGILTPQIGVKEPSHRIAPNDSETTLRNAPNDAKEPTHNLTKHNLTEPNNTPQPPKGEQVPPPEPDEAAIAWKEFASTWNKTPGVVKCQAGNESRRKSFRARLKERVLVDGKPTPWIDAAKIAMQRHFPLKLCESDPAGWKPDIDFFLRPASVLKVLEGKYDWAKNGKRPRDSGAGQRFDPATAGGSVVGW